MKNCAECGEKIETGKEVGANIHASVTTKSFVFHERCVGEFENRQREFLGIALKGDN